MLTFKCKLYNITNLNCGLNISCTGPFKAKECFEEDQYWWSISSLGCARDILGYINVYMASIFFIWTYTYINGHTFFLVGIYHIFVYAHTLVIIRQFDI